MIHEGPDFPRVAQNLIDGYLQTTPANVGHLLREGFCDAGIRPVFRRARIVGTAFTVQLCGEDLSAISCAYERAKPGDVLVVSNIGSTFACAGEISTYKSMRLQLKGLIVDGPVTDILEFEAIGFPCFARCASALVGKRIGKGGAVRVPVVIGGVTVHPGDLVVADDNGIVFLNPEKAMEVLPALLEKEKSELAIREAYWQERGEAVPVFYE
jgi:regulator of RNase E activity RraA